MKSFTVCSNNCWFHVLSSAWFSDSTGWHISTSQWNTVHGNLMWRQVLYQEYPWKMQTRVPNPLIMLFLFYRHCDWTGVSLYQPSVSGRHLCWLETTIVARGQCLHHGCTYSAMRPSILTWTRPGCEAFPLHSLVPLRGQCMARERALGPLWRLCMSG